MSGAAAERARELLREGGSDAGCLAFAAARGGEVVQRKRGRRVVRFPGDGGALFVKVFDGERAKEAAAEAAAYRRLAVTGVPAASLLAVETDPATGRTALALADAGMGLDEAVEREALRPARLATLLRRAGRTVRALHGAGFRFPDLLAWHLRVGRDGEVRVLDPARLVLPRGRRAPDDTARARDLGALLGTMPRLATTERARLRLFLHAVADVDPAARRRLAERTVREVRRTRAKSRYRHRRVDFGPGEREALAGACGDGGFDAWFTGEPGTRLRRLPDRENRRIQHGGRTLFLKRHFHGSRAALDELEGTLAFRRAGVPAHLPAAVGEDVDAGSFWLAAAFPGEPLDDLLRRPGGVDGGARRELARLLGRHAARLRRAGLFHRDLYLNHWMGRRTPEGGWELSLIDLQRWGRVRFRRERWHVKDAAALWHSARGTPVTRADGLRFVRESLGVRRLDRTARAFVAAVLRRAARMASRTPRTPAGGGDA